MNPLETSDWRLEQPIIAADLEGTLTSGETWRGIQAYLEQCGRGREYAAFARRHLLDYLAAKIGVIPKRAFQNRWISDLPRLFAGATLEEFSEVAAWVAHNELLPKLRQSPLSELRAARASGARVILVSGTYQPVLEVFAANFGFEAIGTPLGVLDGRLTGRLSGPVNAGAVKPSSLQRLIATRVLARAYGDTMPDVPLLELALEAVVVTGNDAALERLAEQRGWRKLE